MCVWVCVCVYVCVTYVCACVFVCACVCACVCERERKGERNVWKVFVYQIIPLFCPRGLSFTWWGCCSLCLWHNPTDQTHCFLFCSCLCFCLYGLFNHISFHQFSRQLSALSLCSSSLISALLVLSTIYLFHETLPQPWYNPLWLTGLEVLTN